MMQVKALYSVSELAALAGVSRRQMLRIAVERLGVPKPGPRKKMLVPLEALQSAFPALWASILTACALADN